jgi:hypothetical protein
MRTFHHHHVYCALMFAVPNVCSQLDMHDLPKLFVTCFNNSLSNWSRWYLRLTTALETLHDLKDTLHDLWTVSVMCEETLDSLRHSFNYLARGFDTSDPSRVSRPLLRSDIRHDVEWYVGYYLCKCALVKHYSSVTADQVLSFVTSKCCFSVQSPTKKMSADQVASSTAVGATNIEFKQVWLHHCTFI